MKQPESPLPWNITPCEYIEYTDIVDSQNETLLTADDGYTNFEAGVYSTKDAEYIVEACNNYPEAVELLGSIVPSLYEKGLREEGWRIQNFLHKIGML